MMQWLLLLLQVLASCLWLGHTEVVKSFETCPKFFYKETFPSEALKPENPAWICQRYNNQYHYATLYDRERRIPVYSAYIYQPEPGNRPPSYWLVEPQLISENKLKEMENPLVLIKEHKFSLEDIKESQAVLEDYDNEKDLDRGHLSPNGHHDSKESKLATFTLTNTVPQYSDLNRGKWNSYEYDIMSKNSKGCTTTHVITGAVPGKTSIANGRVNRPSHIWSAACCMGDNDHKAAWGVIAENDKNRRKLLMLGELEDMLTELYGRGEVTLFHKDCPRK